MKRWLSVTLQVLAGLGQVVSVVTPILGPKQKVYVATGLGVAQVVVNAIAHGSNPDGTPAEAPWIPANKK